MTQNIKGMNQSIRNAGDAISLIQVAEGATNEITAMLQRMSELAVQSSNSTYSTEQRGYLDQEFQQLKQEIVRISETHEWNGFPILNGKAGTPVGYPNVSTDARPAVKANETGLSLKADDLVIEVLKADGSKVPAKIPASLASDDTLSSEIATSSNKAGSAIAIAAAINKVVGTTGVRATAVGAQINATKTVVGATSIQTDLYVNGTKISLSLTAGQTVGERRQYVIDSVNAGTATHGVTAGDGGNGGLSLKTIDGRNLSVWYDNSSGIKGQDFGLGGVGDVSTDPEGVTGIAGASLAAAAGTRSNETATITFPTLFSGESYTLNGLQFNARSTVSPSQLANAFSSLKPGTTAAEANTAKNLTSTTVLGSFDINTGFNQGDFTTSAASGATLIANAAKNGNVEDIQQSWVTTTPRTTSTQATTTTGLAASLATKSYVGISFPNLAPGESVTVGDLTFTASASATTNLSGSNVAGYFYGQLKATPDGAPIASIGSFNGGATLKAAWVAPATNNVSVLAIEAKAAGVLDVPTLAAVSSGELVYSSTPTQVVGAAAVTARTQQETYTFQALRAGESVKVGDLTFTASAPVTGTTLASIFYDKLQSTPADPSATTVGVFSGTAPSGWQTASAPSSTSSSLLLAASTTGSKTSPTISQASQTTLGLIDPDDGLGGTVNASTVYGTVTLNSNSAFTVRPGANAYPSASADAKDATFTNFTQLGFNADTINAKSIGRLSFQVGPSPDQLISIDLADFGQNGEITGAITSSRAPTNILTVQSANDVTQSVNKSLDMIAQTRASMGAVMNRLEHVIDNLTNVVMNSEASRSQIEDADYAKASTELARTQIMQQAATAVLAQANTSQQSVLKLLQA